MNIEAVKKEELKRCSCFDKGKQLVEIFLANHSRYGHKKDLIGLYVGNICTHNISELNRKASLCTKTHSAFISPKNISFDFHKVMVDVYNN